jgi:hypothetical protein
VINPHFTKSHHASLIAGKSTLSISALDAVKYTDTRQASITISVLVTNGKELTELQNTNEDVWMLRALAQHNWAICL